MVADLDLAAIRARAYLAPKPHADTTVALCDALDAARATIAAQAAEIARLSLLAAQVPGLAAERDHYSERAAANHARADALAAECADLRRQLAHERDRCPQCGARRVGRWPAGERCPDCRHFDDPALDDPTTETSR